MTTRETTTSDVHEIRIGADLAGRHVAGHWRYVVNMEATPGALARLAVRLPDKYPGKTLRFDATAVGAGAGLTLRREGGAAAVEIGVRYSRLRSVRQASRLARDTLSLGGGISW